MESVPLARLVEVVLVEPKNSRNVGSVMRAMHNLGFTRLTLVNPRAWDPEQAHVTACAAGALIDQARICASMEEAISGAGLIAGFTGHGPYSFARPESLPAWTAGLELRGNVALVFGPEESGLRREHLEICHYLVRIPASASNASYNLAQAVLLALYELRRRWPEDIALPVGGPPPASQEQFVALDALLGPILEQSEFYHRGTSGNVVSTVRSMLRRLMPTDREMRILLGMLSRIGKALEGRETALSHLKNGQGKNVPDAEI